MAHKVGDVGASIASGSFQTLGMIVAPCSVRTMSEIATGVTSTLLTRAADVTLKERRPLVLMVRETPLHLGHLRTMVRLAEMGAMIAPPLPAFYAKPQIHRRDGRPVGRPGAGPVRSRPGGRSSAGARTSVRSGRAETRTEHGDLGLGAGGLRPAGRAAGPSAPCRTTTARTRPSCCGPCMPRPGPGAAGPGGGGGARLGRARRWSRCATCAGRLKPALPPFADARPRGAARGGQGRWNWPPSAC